jgi:hypothetical protein
VSGNAGFVLCGNPTEVHAPIAGGSSGRFVCADVGAVVQLAGRFSPRRELGWGTRFDDLAGSPETDASSVGCWAGSPETGPSSVGYSGTGGRAVNGSRL